jgi:hypothetical protein
MGTVTPLFKKKKPPVLQLDNARNTLLLGLSAIMLFSIEGTPPMLENSSCCFGRNTVNFDQLVNVLSNPKDKESMLNEFIKMLYRYFVQETIIVVEDYCQRSGQNNLLQQQPWYPFARAIKCSLVSGFTFNMDSIANDSMPIKWREKQITEDMRGESLLSTFFDFDDAWDLVEEIRSFAVSLD